MTEPSCLKDLEENSFDIYCKVSSIILKLLDNIIKEPTNPKYRRLRIGNATVSGTLLPAIGAMECLFYIGFKEVKFYLAHLFFFTRLSSELVFEVLKMFRFTKDIKASIIYICVLIIRQLLLQKCASAITGKGC